MSEMIFSQEQSDAWHYLNDQITTEILFGGGAGGGKSWLGCLWHITRRVTYPGSRGLIGRKELKSIKESTMVTYFKVCQELGYKAGDDYKINLTDMFVEWANGSRTIFKQLKDEPSDPNFESLGSTEFTDAFIDEAGEISEKAFDIVNSRIRWMLHEYDLKPKILLTCNPNPNWIKDKYIKNQAGGLISLKGYQKYVRALVTSNPNKDFAKIYIEQLNKMSSVYDRGRLLDGDWDAVERTGGEFYKSFREERHIRPGQYNPSLPVHISWDENVNPYLPCGIFQLEGKSVSMLHEIAGRNPRNTIKAVCSDIRSWLIQRNHTSGLFVYGDATSKKDDVKLEKGHNLFTLILSELKDFRPHLRVLKSNPSVRARGDFMNAVLESEYSGISITIDASCKLMVNDLIGVKEAADGTKDKKMESDPKTGVRYQKFGHFSDLLDYLMCYAFAIEYKAFQTGNKKPTFRGGANISAGLIY